MDWQKVRLTNSQIIDGETTQESHIMDTIINEPHLLAYSYQMENKPVDLSLAFNENQLLIKIKTHDYHAVIPLEKNEKTIGHYYFGEKTIQLEFVLHKIVRKGVEIYMEYDIFSKQSVISNNTWKIEVI